MYGAGELERVRDESVRRLDGGGLPVLAERRLADLFGAGGERFTSNLSVAGLALAQPSGLRPVAQVMGACVYHSRYATTKVAVGDASPPGNAYPLQVAAEPWNAGRDKALGRLAAEARSCGADAVVGVSVQQTQEDTASSHASLECVATGTAVVGVSAPGSDGPVLTSLSVPDFLKLLQQGHAPVGLVACTTVVGCKPSPATVQAETRSGPYSARWQAREIPEYTKGLAEAHRVAFQDMHDQAARLGATGIVGVTISREHHSVLPKHEKAHHQILVVHALGTAITPGTAPPASGGPLTFTPVTHLIQKGGTAR